MPFRLRKDARQWFQDLKSDFDVDFDIYYFCLMAGLATGRRAEVGPDDATDLIDYFPADYRPQGPVIISLFLSRELKRMGISLNERAALHTEIGKLLQPSNPSNLSDTGMREMNRYAFGGFEVLTAWFDDRPRALETFLPLYKRHIQNISSSEHIVL